MATNPLNTSIAPGCFSFTVFFKEPGEAPADVSGLCAELEGFLEENGAGPRQSMALIMAAEELLTNVAKHGAGPDDATAAVMEAEGKISGSGGKWVFDISDNGVAFDPTRFPDPDLSVELAERPIGGLGLYMLRQYFDCVYRRENDRNHSRWVIRPDEGK